MAIPVITGTPTSGSRTGSGSFTVSLPSGASGFLAVGAWYATAGSSVTPPSGFTLVAQGANSGDTNWSRWGIWTGTSGAGTSWSIANSDQGVQVVIVGYDGALTASLLSTTNAATSSAIPSCPSITTDAPALLVRVLTGNFFSGTPAVTYPSSAPDGRTTSYVAAGDERFLAAVAHETRSTAGSTGTAAYNVTGTQAYWITAHSLQLTTTGGGGSFNGTAARSGTGSTTVAHVLGKVTGAPRAGTGSITTGHTLGRVTGASRTGTGAITATGVLGKVSGASRTGTGAISATGSVVSGGSGTAARTGAGAITAAGTVAKFGTAGATATGSIAATASAAVTVRVLRLPQTNRITDRTERSPFWLRNPIYWGGSLLKIDGTYRTIEAPSEEELEAASEVYLGGRDYELSAADEAALTAAGYGGYITSVEVTT